MSREGHVPQHQWFLVASVCLVHQTQFQPEDVNCHWMPLAWVALAPEFLVLYWHALGGCEFWHCG